MLCTKAKTERNVVFNISSAVDTRGGSGQTAIAEQSQRSLRSSHGKGSGHHIFIRVYFSRVFMRLCRVSNALLDMRLYVSCNPQGHSLTCRFGIPQDSFIYKTSELQEMAGVASWETSPLSWIDCPRHSFLLLNWGHPVPDPFWAFRPSSLSQD